MAFDAGNELSSVHHPQVDTNPESQRVSARSFVSVTLWRIVFLGSAVVMGIVLVQALWVTSFGGLGGLRGWVIQMTKSSADAGYEWGWLKMSGLVGALLAVLVISWRKQSTFLRATHAMNRR